MDSSISQAFFPKYAINVHWRDTLEGQPNSRILVYDPTSKSTYILLKDVYFPNGIALSRNNSFFLFAETSSGRINKHHLKGNLKGNTETLNKNLPGLPNNIRYNAQEDILYVGIIMPLDTILDLLQKFPFVNSLLALYPSLLQPFNRTSKMGLVLAFNDNSTLLSW